MVVHCCLKSFALKLSAECRIFLPELANIARAWLKFSLLQRTLGSFANGGEKGMPPYPLEWFEQQLNHSFSGPQPPSHPEALMVVHCCLKSFALKLSAECRIFLPELANIARAWLKFSLLQRTLGSFANGGEKGIYIYIYLIYIYIHKLYFYV